MCATSLHTIRSAPFCHEALKAHPNQDEHFQQVHAYEDGSSSCELPKHEKWGTDTFLSSESLSVSESYGFFTLYVSTDCDSAYTLCFAMLKVI